MYDRFSGGRERALRVLERSLAEPGTASSAETVWLMEIDDQLAGVMAAFPVDEAGERSRAFQPDPAAARRRGAGDRPLPLLGRRSRGSSPPRAPSTSMLWPGEQFRRRGAARALLAEAEQRGAQTRLPAIALDTTIDNAPARALYGREGYDEVATAAGADCRGSWRWSSRWGNRGVKSRRWGATESRPPADHQPPLRAEDSRTAPAQGL